MNIAIDLDRVIYDLKQVETDVFRSQGFAYVPATSWEMGNWPEQIKKKVLSAYSLCDFMCNENYIMWKSDILQKIKKYFKKIYIITARFPSIKKETEKMIKKWGNGLIDDVVVDQDKSRWYCQLDIDLMIDDNPKNLSARNNILISNFETVYNHTQRSYYMYYENLLQIINDMESVYTKLCRGCL